MKIEVYMQNDLTRFAGKIDDKEFDYNVEEFINLIGAFQKAVYKVQNIEHDEKDIVSAINIPDENKKENGMKTQLEIYFNTYKSKLTELIILNDEKAGIKAHIYAVQNSWDFYRKQFNSLYCDC